MVIDNKYELGEIVYLVTDTEQAARIITGIIIRPTGIIYYLSCGKEEGNHYEIEMSRERNMVV